MTERERLYLMMILIGVSGIIGTIIMMFSQ
jgi:hypothetical protein